MKKTLQKLLSQYPDKIAEIGDESFSGDGYWLYLKPGWRICDDQVHSVHEWNMKDLLTAFRSIVPCDCQDCQKS